MKFVQNFLGNYSSENLSFKVIIIGGWGGGGYCQAWQEGSFSGVSCQKMVVYFLEQVIASIMLLG